WQDGQRAVVPAEGRRRAEGKAVQWRFRRRPGRLQGAAGALVAGFQPGRKNGEDPRPARTTGDGVGSRGAADRRVLFTVDGTEVGTQLSIDTQMTVTPTVRMLETSANYGKFDIEL